MLIDDVTITIQAGNGGDGAVSFRRNAQTAKGGPNGGNGGNGGDVYIQGSTNIFDLKQFQYKKKIHAEDGIAGKKNNLFGRNGKDLTIPVPIGTRIVDEATKTEIEIEYDGQSICIAKGGKGGKGNTEFKSATNQAPRFAEKGEKGEEKIVRLQLRYIADIGLVGFPNSGKSTLLSLLTNAKPKIGNYPFTTLDPNLGKTDQVVIADIPGIIQGASKGKGLGLRFLKHIEKTQLLFYCIECTEKDPFAVYVMLRNEFKSYNPTLLEKPEIILLTKCDLIDKQEVEEKKKQFAKKIVIGISQHDPESIEVLQKEVKKQLSR